MRRRRSPRFFPVSEMDPLSDAPPASMSIGEWQFEPIGCGIRQPLYAVSREVVILSLLPVGDNRRARSLELLDRVPNGFVVKRLQTMMQAAVPFDCIKQFQGARNTTDRFGRNRHGSVLERLRPRS